MKIGTPKEVYKLFRQLLSQDKESSKLSADLLIKKALESRNYFYMVKEIRGSRTTLTITTSFEVDQDYIIDIVNKNKFSLDLNIFTESHYTHHTFAPYYKRVTMKFSN